jgi:hypothetical protein
VKKLRKTWHSSVASQCHRLVVDACFVEELNQPCATSRTPWNAVSTLNFEREKTHLRKMHLVNYILYLSTTTVEAFIKSQIMTKSKLTASF